MDGLLSGVAQTTETQETGDATMPGATTAGATPAADWRSGLGELANDENLQAFKSVGDLAQSYINTKKLVGKKTIGLPGETSGEDEWNQFYQQLGRPVRADEYQIKREIAEEFQDKEQVSAFLSEAHKLGLTNKQVQGVISAYDKQYAAMIEGEKQSLSQKREQVKIALEKEFGADFNARMYRAEQVLATLNKDGKIDVSELRDNAAAIKILDKIAGQVLNEQLPVGYNNNSMSSIDSQIQSLLASPAMQNRDHADHERAMNQYSILMQKKSSMR